MCRKYDQNAIITNTIEVRENKNGIINKKVNLTYNDIAEER